MIVIRLRIFDLRRICEKKREKEAVFVQQSGVSQLRRDKIYLKFLR